MIVALIGISGVGKTYYKNIISNKLGFAKVNTIRSRCKRINETDNSALFYTENQIKELEKEEKIIFSFKAFGNIYAYLKEDILTERNMIVEMHYDVLDDFKKIVDKLVTIYIAPRDINVPIEYLKQRCLSKREEKLKMDDLMKHYDKFLNNASFREKFDYIVYNDYNYDTENEITEIINKIVGE